MERSPLIFEFMLSTIASSVVAAQFFILQFDFQFSNLSCLNFVSLVVRHQKTIAGSCSGSDDKEVTDSGESSGSEARQEQQGSDLFQGQANVKEKSSSEPGVQDHSENPLAVLVGTNQQFEYAVASPNLDSQSTLMKE